MRAEKIKKAYGDLKFFYSVARSLAKLIFNARKKGHALGLAKSLRNHVILHLHGLLSTFTAESRDFGDLDAPSYVGLQNKCRGLHSLLPDNQKFQYSILIPVYHPQPRFFERAIKSAIDQSAPHIEILLGLDGPQSPEVMAVIDRFIKSSHVGGPSIRVIEVDRLKSGGGISHTTNALADAATGTYLLLMDHDDWIAPDLLFRYEQCLRLHKTPENVVLYCNEYKINEKDERLFGSEVIKPEHPVFPYLFVNFICHCLLVPKNLWNKVGGLRSECDGAQDFDLCLRLDLASAHFQNVPFPLYAWRAHSESTAARLGAKDYATPAGIRAFQEYTVKKGLDWEISQGYFPTVYRAVPKLNKNHGIHVIIPYKDQKEWTLKAVNSVLSQGIGVSITAVDNRSQDKSIQVELEALGVEVFKLDEPFNYSRINNFAVKNSRFATSTDCLLFLNNDVELSAGALEEMLRWIDQPRIGMVGAKLNYPNNLLQHGGVTLARKAGGDGMMWTHIDCHMGPDHQGPSKITGICDAVTAACMLIKRETFLKLGGFDEIWYPIAFSDTDLAVKARRMGLYSFYTPYACGIHYESATRGPGYHENPDASTWLFRVTADRNVPQESLKDYVFF